MGTKVKDTLEEAVKVGIEVARPNSEWQKDFVKSIKKRQVVKAGRQCLAEDEYVYTPKGIKPAGDIQEDDIIIGGQVSGVKHYTAPIYELTFCNGIKIKVSGEHPFWYKKGLRCAEGWVEAEAIEKRIGVKAGHNASGYVYFEPSELKGEKVAHAKLLGYMLSDGSFCDRQAVKFTNINKVFLWEVTTLALNFGLETHLDSKGKGYDLHMTYSQGHANPLRLYIKSLGATNDSFGQIVNGDRETILQFLKGYFNGDGYLYIRRRKKDDTRLTNCEVGFCTATRRKSFELQYILWRLGILSTIKSEWMSKSTKPFYRVLISGRFCQRLLSLLDDTKYPDKFREALSLPLSNKYLEEGDGYWLAVRSVKIIGEQTVVGWQTVGSNKVISYCGMRTHNSGKTFGVSIKAALAFLGICWNCLGEGCNECDHTGKTGQKRVLYAAPTSEQTNMFWYEVVEFLRPGIEAGAFKKDETDQTIEVIGTNIILKAKTAWNANTLRGGNWDVLILEEFQLMNEDTWTDVGAPMLLLTDGIAIFIFTPPSLKSEGVSKAKDPRHASKLFKKALLDETGRWETFHATSLDNPALSREALSEIIGDMSADSYRREIMAEDDEIETSWLVYGTFDETLCKIKRFIIPDTWPVYTGHDFGTANPAALFVAQVRLPLPPNVPPYLRYGDYVAFSEYCPGAGFSAQQHIDKYRDILGKNDDGSPRLKLSRAVGGNVTTEEETRQLYRRMGWYIEAPSITRVNLQVDRALAIIEQNQFYIFEDLHQLLMQLANCMWVLDEDNKPTNKIKDEARYHALSCLRYLATILSPKYIPTVDKAGGYINGVRVD